jgi:hypothetical protein
VAAAGAFPFLFVGPKLKATASEPEIYVLFERPVPEGDRALVVDRLPAAVTRSVSWSDRLLHVGGDATFRSAVKDTLGSAAAFDAAIETWATETHAEHPLVCVLDIDGKGASLSGKKLIAEITGRVLPALAAHFDQGPVDSTGSWFLYLLLDQALRTVKSLDEATFAALARAVGRAIHHGDRNSLLYLVRAHQELVDRAPFGAADRLEHPAAVRLAFLLKAHRHDESYLDQVRALAQEVDAAGALLVARMAAWLLGGGPGLSAAEAAAVAEALLEGEAIRTRPPDEVSIGRTLEASAESVERPFGRTPTADEQAQAQLLRQIAGRFADAAPPA